MTIHNIIENVGQIYKKYGNKITNDKQLLLIYWKLCDEVKMDKVNMSVEEFLNKATEPNKILSAKLSWKILSEKEE